MRKPNGYIIIIDPEAPTIESDTLQCCHCLKHWMVKPGSGIQRGWCYNCMKPHCGSEECVICVPWEKQFEEIERKATREMRLGV